VNQADLDRIFDHHPPTTDDEIAAHEQVREAFKRMALAMSNLPSGREQSLVMTKLEEASFFAHAALARLRA